MSSTVSRANNGNIGTCPHGLPVGACPICNGGGGGGGGGAKRQDSKANELSWNECYAIGQMMKAQKHARQQTEQLFAQQIQNAFLLKISQQFAQLKAAILNYVPPVIVKSFEGIKNVAAALVLKVANVVSGIFEGVAKFASAVKETFINITDKLAAMMGEMKNAIEKQISEKFKDLKKKIFNLFGLAVVDDDEDDEAQRIEEMNRQFEMTETNKMIFNPKDIKKAENEHS
jgi:hypothetical protein